MADGAAALFNNELEAVARSQFEEAMDMLDESDIKIYRHALVNHPELVEKESNPMWFITYADGDYHAAAKRMVEWWKIRFEAFGEERVYKKVLDLSGEQALSNRAIQILNTGVLYILPSDTENRLVLFLDRSKLTPQIMKRIGGTLQDEQQARYFIFLKVATIESSRTFGFSFVQLVRELKPRVRPEAQNWVLRLTKESLPSHWRLAYIVCAPPTRERLNPYQDFKDFLWQTMMRTASLVKGRHIVVLEPGASKEQIGEAMVRAGMRKEYLPLQAGGKWSYAKSKKWLLEVERRQKDAASVLAEDPVRPSPLDVLAAAAAATTVNGSKQHNRIVPETG